MPIVTPAQTRKQDIIYIDSINRLAFEFRNIDPDTSLLFATEALNLSRSLNYKSGIGNALAQVGIAMRNKGEFDKSLDAFRRSIEIRIELKQFKSCANAYNSMGSTFKHIGRLDSALTYYLAADSLHQLYSPPKNLAVTSSNVAAIFDMMGDYESASFYYDNALSIYSELEDTHGVGEVLMSLGILQYNLRNFVDASNYFDSSYYYLNRGNDNYNLAKLFSNRGLAFDAQGAKREAINEFVHAASISSSIDDVEGTAIAYHNIGNAYTALGVVDSASNSYLTAIRISKEGHMWEIVAKSYLQLSKLMELYGDDEKAFDFFRRYTELQDSLSGLDEAIAVQGLMIKYQTKQKELEIVGLTSDKQSLILTIGGLISLLVIALLILFYFRQRHKSKLQLQAKESELQATNALIDGQETERKRIARELHDSLGSLLSATKLQLEAVDTKIDRVGGVQRQEFEKANELLSEAVHEVRRISHNMISSVLVNFGLVDALNDLAASMENARGLGVSVLAVGFEERKRPDPKIELSAYRIVQELLQNVIKHADAKSVSIRAQLEENELKLVVKDDGVGFDSGNLQQVSGIGLRNIFTRVEYLKGALTLESQPGAGTKVIVTFPLLPEE